MTELKNINDAIMPLRENNLLHVIMYGNKNLGNNISLPTVTNTLLNDPERFDHLFFNQY